MSAETFISPDPAGRMEWESTYPHAIETVRTSGWKPEDFAREQIRGLVRQVFFSSADRSIRQVVFRAVDPEKEILSICRQVGEALASETQGSVSVVGGFPHILEIREIHSGTLVEKPPAQESGQLRESGTRVRPNLWWIPTEPERGNARSANGLHAYLGQIRREFDYSIIEAPSTAQPHEAMEISQFADGVILVLSARHTRRAVARMIKNSLEKTRSRILGTVLSDRVFPIPDALYRRL